MMYTLSQLPRNNKFVIVDIDREVQRYTKQRKLKKMDN